DVEVRTKPRTAQHGTCPSPGPRGDRSSTAGEDGVATPPARQSKWERLATAAATAAAAAAAAAAPPGHRPPPQILLDQVVGRAGGQDERAHRIGVVHLDLCAQHHLDLRTRGHLQVVLSQCRPRVRQQAPHEVLVAPRSGYDLTPHQLLGNLRDHATLPPGLATEKNVTLRGSVSVGSDVTRIFRGYGTTAPRCQPGRAASCQARLVPRRPRSLELSTPSASSRSFPGGRPVGTRLRVGVQNTTSKVRPQRFSRIALSLFTGGSVSKVGGFFVHKSRVGRESAVSAAVSATVIHSKPGHHDV